MSEYRKLSAHFIFPVHSPPIQNGIITVDHEGKIIDIQESSQKETYNVEFYNGIIVPGFVNCHCHLELSHLRNILHPGGEITGFITQMRERRNEKAEKAVSEATMYDQLMFKEGIVAVADIVNSDITAKLKNESLIHYINYIEVFGLNESEAGNIFNRARQLKKLFKNSHISPHALYSLSPGLANLLSLHKEDTATLHYMEASDEAAYLRTLTGNLKANYQQYFPNEKHQPASLDQLFNPTTKLLLIHNLYISKNEEEYIQQQFPESYRVLCPASNLYISNQCPSYQIFKEDRICLGTDSLASNQKLSMLQEMLEMQNAHPELCFETLLSWACINGANALDVSKEMGSFEPGKKPGIVLLENFDFQTFRITKKTTSKRLV